MSDFESKIKDHWARREERWMRRQERWKRNRSGRSHVWMGVFFLIVGGVALMKAALVPLPEWLFTWQMLLIALGFFLGVRHGFRGGAWLIPMLVGSVFLIDEFFPDLILRQYLWPLALIIVGLFFILRPRHHSWRGRELKDVGIDQTKTTEKLEASAPAAENEKSFNEDFIDSTSVFGGNKRNVVSKQFKGGEIVNIMGGTEINLTQADIQGTVVLEVIQIFGGTQLIVPSNWKVKSEMVSIFGGIDDKRNVQSMNVQPDKVLIVKGTSIFGGIEIKSY